MRRGRCSSQSGGGRAAGKIPIDFRALDVTALTISGHKFGGPAGVGALLLKRGTKLRPLFHGGHQQQGRRPGTEPVALAVGMAAALDVAVRRMEANTSHVRRLREQFLERLRAEATNDTNLMPAIIDAARAHVTVGEMCDTLRATWGVWRETPVY